MNLRIATPEDAECIAELVVEFRNHLERTAPSDAQFQASVSHLLGAEDAAFYLAIEGGTAIGYVLQRFRFSMWAAGLEATIEDLFVSPKHRQSGTGKRLIQFALDQAKAKACTSVCLDTNENNLASTRIYTGLGSVFKVGAK
jgi:ribosomal protein S18 acetylase RimI-like enzyme